MAAAHAEATPRRGTHQVVAVSQVKRLHQIADAGVGAVVLANADNGRPLLRSFMRKLIEVLFDGKPEAIEDVVSAAKRLQAEQAKARQRLVVPADAQLAARLAKHYVNAALGELTVRSEGGATVFDFGEWYSAVATHKNGDGTSSFITIDPGFDAYEFVVADKPGKRALIIRDPQHEYVFNESSN